MMYGPNVPIFMSKDVSIDYLNSRSGNFIRTRKSEPERARKSEPERTEITGLETEPKIYKYLYGSKIVLPKEPDPRKPDLNIPAPEKTLSNPIRPIHIDLKI
ncbi:hypothetical protein YC2023_075340 [Brassica napus]